MGKPVPARCTCGIQFSVVFERRANYRKSTGLQGRFTRNLDSEMQVGEVVVADLSRGGICMTVPESVELEIGEVLRIDFRLDNQEETVISAQVVIKNIRQGMVGAEFCALEEHTRKLLGYYLMP
jgi:c-di-GMP-binding flagellar brake protein YcgR